MRGAEWILVSNGRRCPKRHQVWGIQGASCPVGLKGCSFLPLDLAGLCINFLVFLFYDYFSKIAYSFKIICTPSLRDITYQLFS